MGTAYEKAAAVEGMVQEKVKEHVKNSFYNQAEDEHFTEDEEPVKKEPLPEKSSPAVSEGPAPMQPEPPLPEEPAASVPAFTIEYSTEKDGSAVVEAAEDTTAAEPAVPPLAPSANGPAEKAEEKAVTPAAAQSKPYELPKVKYILSKRVKKKNAQLEREIAEKAHVLASTLDNFHAALIQREMVTQFTTSLDCVKIGLIHSDYSFVCDVSQNHFNTGSHYGFLFFD